ncbi:MAG: hypothetical protein DRP03_02120 [Candidatus Aenigmatarchaeota archaeon]|nr:MAG: hypothetical protein DRP03_02120 [Candidatus Aenigmarchaeota archaeon]
MNIFTQYLDIEYSDYIRVLRKWCGGSMKRKVIKQGHNTLTITIPSKWAKRYGVKAGDEIDVHEKDRSLIITVEKNTSKLSCITLNISGLPARLVWRYILSAYRAGYNEIRIEGIEGSKKTMYSSFSYDTIEYLRSKDNKIEMSQMEIVQAISNRLVGVEIIDQKEHFCVIKELGETSCKEFNNALRRMFIILKDEAEIMEEAFNNKKERLKLMHIVDTNLDRFEDFCIRVLNKNGYENFRKTPIMHSIIFFIELIGDEFKMLAKHMINTKEKPSKGMRAIFRAYKEQIERFIDLFYKFSQEKTKNIYEQDAKITALINKHYSSLTKRELEWLYHLKKIGSHINTLTELVIDMQF